MDVVKIPQEGNTTPVASTSSSSNIPMDSNTNFNEAVRVERIQPIFRIVTNVDKYAKSKSSEKRDPSAEESAAAVAVKRQRGELYANDTGPFWHKMSNSMITPPIITQNLHLQFKDLPIYGAPSCPNKLDDFQNRLLKDFVDCNLDQSEYEELENYCNPDNLKSGKELTMTTQIPVPSLLSKNLLQSTISNDYDRCRAEDQSQNLHILKKLKLRQELDVQNVYPRLSKYRGVKLMPLADQEKITPSKLAEPSDLCPGQDTLFRIRVYRPFSFFTMLVGDKHVRGRHSVFQCDIIMLGRQKLTTLRDRFTCRNDVDMRLDVSDSPDHVSSAAAKDVFPSGFLFINNVFYVDERGGCLDMSVILRRWASERGLGHFQTSSMDVTLDQILVKLAHPEVYMHQGNCEHVFLFSEIRLLSRSDPLHLSSYPCQSAVSQNQTIYCTTCAEFGARWLVTGSSRVPFDPAFFCDVCFKQYLYKDGKKIGQFSAYAYRGNEINLNASGKGWMRIAVDREIGEAYVQQWTSIG